MLAAPPVILAAASVVGKKEGEGPLRERFDVVSSDTYFGTSSWEKAESAMLKQCFDLACQKAQVSPAALDYVFSGEPPREPWAWSETDIPRPRTVYGASKFAGEQMIQMLLPEAVIIRIAWLYGAGGPSFVHTMAKLGAQEGAPLKVVNDQRGNPTSTKTVADVIKFLMTKSDVSGIVHGTCEDQCTWYDLTVELFRLLGLKREVVPCTTEEFPRPAPRPHNSALKKSVLNLLGYRTPKWQDALAEFVKTEF